MFKLVHLMKSKNWLALKLLSVCLFISIILMSAYANRNGRTGRTSSSSQGCGIGGGCHATSSNSATTVTVSSGSGSFDVDPESVTTFTVTVSNSSANAAGTNIAVKTTQTGETNAGTLSPSSGSGLQLISGELTHSSPKSMSGGSVSFQFTWTAPTEPGTYYLRAIGNAVNGNGNNDGNDIWNWMSVQTITVKGLTLTSPNGGQSWCVGSTQQISWTQNGISDVKIELSTDGGSSFPITLVNSTVASAGSWTWNIPSDFQTGTSFRIRISDVSSSSRKDESDGSFSISSNVSISSHPQSAEKCTGQSVTFSVSASGGNLTYQWRRNATNIPGANQSSYTIGNLTLAHSGTYDVQVSSICGTLLTSNAATLVVNETPNIVNQPQSQAQCVGGSATFRVSAVGTGITFQWKNNNTDIPGAIDSVYSIDNIQESHAGNYTVVVSGVCTPSKTSNIATLTVAKPPQIKTHPADKVACEGSRTELSVVAEGVGLIYQWSKNGANILGADQATYVIEKTSKTDEGEYEVFVRGLCDPSVKSNKASLLVRTKPSISKQPESKTIAEGSPVSFSVSASGNIKSYQWRKDGSNLAGKTESQLNIASAQTSDAGDYDCIISNDCGDTTSAKAKLTVTAAGPGPVLTLSRSSFVFGIVILNETKLVEIEALMKNTGNEILVISEIKIIGTDASEFSIIDAALPINLNQNEAQSLKISFTPATPGDKISAVEFSTNANIQPSLSLNGFGGFIDLMLADELLDFGEIQIGETAGKSTSITNNGNIQVTITSLSITGSSSNDFEIITPAAPFQLAPAAGQDINIRFSPRQDAISEAILEINYDDAQNPITVQLIGIGKISSGVEELLASKLITTFPNPVSDEVYIAFNHPELKIKEILFTDILGNLINKIELNNLHNPIIKWNCSDAFGNRCANGTYRMVIRSDYGLTAYPIVISR